MPVRLGERYRDRYEVLAHLGEGAFAHVFRARDLETGVQVALKVLKDPYQSEKEVVERFQREVFAVASISSPHVVAMSDFGMSRGDERGEGSDFFMVMELVEGPTLREVMKVRAWTADDVHIIVGQIAHALGAAHRQDIVHRDLKPENVLLVERPGGQWQVKVLDFGLAKLATLQRQLGLRELTQKGDLFGTPQYLSPEQIRGLPLDGRADLFALGVIAYEMLAGRRPWDGKKPGVVMTAVLHDLPPAVTRLHDTIAPRVEPVNAFLLRALAKEPTERPRDADALFAELGVALYGSAVPALAGAAPARPLDRVSSQSIQLVLHPAGRADPTEVSRNDEDRETIQFSTRVGHDTAKETAFDSDWFPTFDDEALGPSGVAGGAERSGTMGLDERTVNQRPHDSQKVTVPRTPAHDPPGPPWPARPPVSRSRLLILVAVVAAVAGVSFWLGHTLR
ncbi:MAG TPA: serine/threonine-protein kinase [Kofleriaceae bacterium]|nr:serine/threonine-protein kinase [Kofleriaceae bacterium]